MSEYQKVFLSYVFIYYLVKVGILIACYFVAKLVMKGARQRQEQDRMSFMKKRADEQERWKVAYSAYYRQKDDPIVDPLELPKLVSDPNSFTAYSNVSRGYFRFGMSA